MSHHTPAEIGKRLGIAAPTLRLWAKEFAPFLSSSAQSGRERRYGDDDLALLRRIAAYREQGLPFVEIKERLHEAQNAPHQVVEILSPARPETAEQSTAIAMYREVIASKEREIAAVQQTLQAVELLADERGQQVAELRTRVTILETEITELRTRHAASWPTRLRAWLFEWRLALGGIFIGAALVLLGYWLAGR